MWPGYPLARVSLLIRRNLHYRRRLDLENSVKPLVVIEVHRSSKKKVLIAAIHRQWQGKSPTLGFNLYENSHQIKCLKCLTESLTKVAEEDNFVMIGDFNISQLRG